MNKEPVLIIEAVKAVLLCAVAFGLNLSDVQLVAVVTALGAVLAVFARSKVTPV